MLVNSGTPIILIDAGRNEPRPDERVAAAGQRQCREASQPGEDETLDPMHHDTTMLTRREAPPATTTFLHGLALEVPLAPADPRAPASAARSSAMSAATVRRARTLPFTWTGTMISRRSRDRLLDTAASPPR